MNEFEFWLFLVSVFGVYFFGVLVGRKQGELDLDYFGREIKARPEPTRLTDVDT